MPLCWFPEITSAHTPCLSVTHLSAHPRRPTARTGGWTAGRRRAGLGCRCCGGRRWGCGGSCGERWWHGLVSREWSCDGCERGERRRRQVKEVESMRRAMLNFVSSEAGTCSGRPVEPVGKLVRWEREAAGLQSGRNGMWRVKEVKDAKRREGTKAAWDVLVSWAGQHEESWVARATLSRPLHRAPVLTLTR
eukprot:5818927-Prymnesium_polylepis.1